MGRIAVCCPQHGMRRHGSFEAAGSARAQHLIEAFDDRSRSLFVDILRAYAQTRMYAVSHRVNRARASGLFDPVGFSSSWKHCGEPLQLLGPDARIIDSFCEMRRRHARGCWRDRSADAPGARWARATGRGYSDTSSIRRPVVRRPHWRSRPSKSILGSVRLGSGRVIVSCDCADISNVAKHMAKHVWRWWALGWGSGVHPHLPRATT